MGAGRGLEGTTFYVDQARKRNGQRKSGVPADDRGRGRWNNHSAGRTFARRQLDLREVAFTRRCSKAVLATVGRRRAFRPAGSKAPHHLKTTRRLQPPGQKRPAGRSPPLAEPPLEDRRLAGLTTGRESISTNLADAGLRSVARNNKATRLLTRPGQTTKSSAKDLSLRIVKLQFAS